MLKSVKLDNELCMLLRHLIVLSEHAFIVTRISLMPRMPWILSGTIGLNGEGNTYCGFWLGICWYHKHAGYSWTRYAQVYFTANLCVLISYGNRKL